MPVSDRQRQPQTAWERYPGDTQGRGLSKMAKPLTAVTIANLRPKPKDSPKRYEVSDGGCQGLRVVVFPSGKRSFITRFRFRGLQRKLTLGPCLIEHN